ncbi:MAG: hypothetical protein GY932_03910 [Arcobacter sp.]|nr:hypothetical protein [Arcobacter sp.]
MKYVLILLFLTIIGFANENFANMKKCEHIKLSKFTTLVSCHKIDYLIEYRNIDDDEKDTIKKITAITLEDTKIIKNIGK